MVWLLLPFLFFGIVTSTKPVNISIYYQTLCPASQFLLQHQVWDVYNDFSKDNVVDIELHAYGNTKEERENGSYTFICQHGELECKLNTIATCVDHLYKKTQQNKVIDFVHCLIESPPPTMHTAKECSSTNGLGWKTIEACSSGLLGYDLQHKEALKTPVHDQIPWVVVNGVGDSADQDDLRSHLKEVVCNQYTGKEPKPCKKKED